MSWDTAVPAGSDLISQGDDVIRQFKTDIQTALRGNATDGDEAKFPGSDPANPVFRYRGLKGTTGARPAAGQYGLYINTTTNTLQRDNGSAWQDVATLIPQNTIMVFANSSVPTGWTLVTSLDGKIMRIINGAGGGTGGSHDVSSAITLAHTHTVASHTHDLGNHTHSLTNHQHQLDYTLTNLQDDGSGANTVIANNSDGAAIRTRVEAGGSTDYRVPKIQTASDGGGGASGAPSSNTSGSAAPATDSSLTNVSLAYVNVVLGSKD